ncbi:MAG: cobalamin B12-binding domain-containing protein [Acidobacteria bacterium]|nr:cobalamin B12-binding domain-containing protein [Acidobacteriota bacterium]
MSDEPLSDEPRHPIQVVVRRTGVSQDLLRAWEKRYAAVVPGRTPGSHRLYSDADIHRLGLIREALDGGRRIGQVAGLANDELAALVDDDRREAFATARPPLPRAAAAASPPEDLRVRHVAACLAAIRELDAPRLEAALDEARLALSLPHLLEGVIGPLLEEIGEAWRRGELRPYHEHMASAALRSFLGGMRGTFLAASNAPLLLVALPAGQHHELSALMAALAGAAEGWRVTYLGPDLPADDIAAAVRQAGARALALGIVFPPDDPELPAQLERLRRGVGPELPLLVFGGSAPAYVAAVDAVGAETVTGVGPLRNALGRLRRPLPSLPIR